MSGKEGFCFQMASQVAQQLSSKEPTYECRIGGFHSCVGKIPYRRKWQPLPLFLPGKFHGQRSPAGYSPWGRKELDMTEQAPKHSISGTEIARKSVKSFFFFF